MFGFKKKTDPPPAADSLAPAPLAARLQRARGGLFGGLFKRFGQQAIDEQTLEALEDRLISADLGFKTTDQIISLLRAESNSGTAPLPKLKALLHTILEPVERPLLIPAGAKPCLILVVGVNGVGKTTTIGKLAMRLQREGRRVMLAAGDTFRAAAIEQLQVWGERNAVRVVAGAHGSDAAAVIYDGLASARASGADLLIADTAGRLHNKDGLMRELQKIHRTAHKFDPALEARVLLVLDAGAGQNALLQARRFNEAVGVSGLVLTKLDGTARGGIIFALADELRLPLHFIGVGEQAADLRPFKAADFIDALLADEA